MRARGNKVVDSMAVVVNTASTNNIHIANPAPIPSYHVSIRISGVASGQAIIITSECETFGGEPELLAAVHSMQQAVC